MVKQGNYNKSPKKCCKGRSTAWLRSCACVWLHLHPSYFRHEEYRKEVSFFIYSFAHLGRLFTMENEWKESKNRKAAQCSEIQNEFIKLNLYARLEFNLCTP